MNTDTAANVQIAGEPDAWRVRNFTGGQYSYYASAIDAAKHDPDKFAEPLCTAARLSAITADRDRLRDVLRFVVANANGNRLSGYLNVPVTSIDAARKALESQ